MSCLPKTSILRIDALLLSVEKGKNTKLKSM
uniref:Uncharacterized protein n=1 Tax=Anguilla anguilla TaxID=7936 RepID=A0A0E9S2P2_ANGAN